MAPAYRKFGWACALIALAAAYFGYSRYRSPRRPNLLLITLDTTRADRLGCYGHQAALTPVLDGLAKQGVLFERACTPIPLTLPAHASMFTGLYPPEHGIHTNGKQRLPQDIPTLAEACRAHGYDTGAFVASFVLDAKFGLDRGFQTYDDDLTGTAPADEALHRHRAGRVVVDQALHWLGGRAARPYFCWVHLYDPHAPYESHPDLFGDQFHDQPYDAEITYVDLQVGRLMDFLKSQPSDPPTLVVVVGDHGEGLGQHEERRHGQMLYQSTLHVPWIMSLPGTIPAGRRIATPVTLPDLSPTLLTALRLNGAKNVSGRNLFAAACGEPLDSLPLYAETDEPWLESGWSPLRAVITDEWKYIRTPRAELFRLTQDADETRNLATELPEQVANLERRLTDLESGLRQRAESTVALSEQEQRQLSGLGYAGHAGADRPSPGPNLPDIKDRIAHHNALEDARQLLDAGKYEEAVAALETLVDAAPDYELAELALGDAFLQQRKLDAARTLYQRVLERNPESALAMLHLGDVCEAQGRFEEALAHYLEAIQREPDSAKLQYNIGRTLVVLQRDAEALERFDAALELDPGYVFAHIERGSVLSRQGLLESALAEYELALRYDAHSVFARMNAARILVQQRRFPEAHRQLEQAAKDAPRDVEVRFQFASFLARQGQAERAKTELHEALRLQPDHAAARQLLNDLTRRD